VEERRFWKPPNRLLRRGRSRSETLVSTAVYSPNISIMLTTIIIFLALEQNFTERVLKVIEIQQSSFLFIQVVIGSGLLAKGC